MTEARLRSGEGQAADGIIEGTPSEVVSVQRRLVEAQRQALSDLRARQVIGDDAFHLAEEEVDLLEVDSRSKAEPTDVADGQNGIAGRRLAPG